jgi:DNA-binding NarL/FixJ family response regulator
MRASLPKRQQRQPVRVAVIESDPLRFVGLRTCLASESDFELSSTSLGDAGAQQNIDLVLLGHHAGSNLFELVATLKAARPDLKVLVMGAGMDEENILKAIASGAKGYIDEAAAPTEFKQAFRVVSYGSVWAPRRVLSLFIERVSNSPGRIFPAGRVCFTHREKEVLEMLVAGRSNKEIGTPLGITERTVKAHVSKLMRKVGVQNRIALSVHAITNSLVFNPMKD